MPLLSRIGPDRVFFKKGRACVQYEQKGHISVNLGQFEDETPRNSMQI